MDANQQQAAVAGAAPVAEVFRRLIARANEQRERNLPDEQKLLRSLMRLDSSEERKGLLFAAFKPTKSMAEDGGFVEGPPLIAPPAFIGYAMHPFSCSSCMECCSYGCSYGCCCC